MIRSRLVSITLILATLSAATSSADAARQSSFRKTSSQITKRSSSPLRAQKAFAARTGALQKRITGESAPRPTRRTTSIRTARRARRGSAKVGMIATLAIASIFSLVALEAGVELAVRDFKPAESKSVKEWAESGAFYSTDEKGAVGMRAVYSGLLAYFAWSAVGIFLRDEPS